MSLVITRKPVAIRRIVFLLVYRSHVWFGLFTAIAVIVVSLTGIYLNHRFAFGFHERLPDRPSRELEEALPIRQIIILGMTGAHEVGHPVRSPQDVNRIMFRPDRGQVAVRMQDSRITEVVLDAYTGEVLRVAGRDDLWMERLHSGEILGQRGVIISDIAAGALILFTIGGLVLWLNRLSRRWGQSVSSSGRGSWWLRVNRRVHLVGGLTVGVLVIAICVTGILLNHKREFGLMVEPFRSAEYAPAKFPPVPLARMAEVAIGATTNRAMSSREIQWIDFRPGLAYTKVRLKDDRDTEVLVNSYDLEVISVASRTDALLERIHSGEFIGAHWVLLSDLVAVILIMLTFNGLYLWVTPIWSARSRTSRQPLANGK